LTGRMLCAPTGRGAQRAPAGGTLILSGILVDRAAEVVAACAARGLRLAEERKKSEWWAGSFRI